jgi:transcriptional regulator with GAF, ATPase, and Fis domain
VALRSIADPMSEPAQDHWRPEADTPDNRLERLTRLEAVDALLPPTTFGANPAELLRHAAEILKQSVPCEGVSIVEAIDEAAAEPSPDAESFGRQPAALRVAATAGGRTVAVIDAAAAPGGFSVNDRAVIARVADRLALGLLAARLADAQQRRATLEQRTAQLDALLATLASAPDVRDVFDRVSEIGKTVLPHDAMTIVVGGETPGKVRIFAATGAMSHLPLQVELPLPNQPLLNSPAGHIVVPDLALDDRYRSIPAVRAGMRSIISMLNRVGGRVHSAVNFLSATPGRFTPDDVPIARRIADHIGLALSQQRVADESRRVEILQARNTNLALLDELLKTLSDDGELADVIEGLSQAAKSVLPHDATVLGVYLAERTKARRYASSGIDMSGIPDIVDVPVSLQSDDWDYQIVDDFNADPTGALSPLANRGFRSALRLAIRLEGRIVGGLTFLKAETHGFKHDDVLVARRIGERVALCLARERGVEATRRADEASERAARLEARVRALTDELDARSGYRRVIGESAPWRTVLTQATQVSATDTTVLLLGESGTGKEVVARLLHRASTRRDGPFVALNCAALPEQLLEAELFGYERGAFTGALQSKPGQLEQASGGVLFLDEVGEMSLPAQAKFLRVLQEREFQRLGGTRVLRTDARVVAATNRDLHKAMTSGQFREDLYYRLNVFAIRLPPLRDRPDDVLALTQCFLEEFSRTFANPPSGISRTARQLLLAYHWPGNVRELRNMLERAAILCDGGLITEEHLSLPAAAPAVRSAPAAIEVEAASPVAPTPSVPKVVPAAAEEVVGDLKAVERTMIERALQQARFNKSRAAKALGLTRHQLYIRMRRHGVTG